MNRWFPWFAAVLVACLVLYSGKTTSAVLLEDTDTIYILSAIRDADDPLSWFTGDWPLKNHFYRPISTLAFEWDNARFGNDPAGYGGTNSLIAVLCIVLLFWLLRELTDSPWFTGSATLLFWFWHLHTYQFFWPEKILVVLGFLCLLGIMRGGFVKVVPCVLATLGCIYLSKQIGPVEPFASRIIAWLPGRTASVMTVFSLISMASFARYVRLTARRVSHDPSPDDIPASKTTPAPVTPSPFVHVWVVLALTAMVLALGSYEQAIMLPAALAGVAILFAVNGLRSSWWPHVAFWVLLGSYLVFRSQILPEVNSGYQDQQLRFGPGVWIAIGAYFLPGVYIAVVAARGVVGAILLVTRVFWDPALIVIANVTTYWQSWKSRKWRWSWLGYLLISGVVYLPMAWLHPFGHYHYWPSALRAPYVIALAAIVLKLIVNAVSLPSLQAPLRHDPAPGSLLHQ